MPGQKSDNVEIQLKVNQILQLMVMGVYRTDDILRYVAEMDKLTSEEQAKRNWIKVDKERRTIEDYIARAKEMLREQGMRDLKEVKELYSAQLEDLYRRAVKEGKIRDANAIMANKIHLHGLGGVNIRGSLNVKSFDVKLTPEEEKQYEDALREFAEGQVLEKDDGA